MILVDASVWIEFLRGNKAFRLSPEDFLHIATCGPILQEVLQGFPDSPRTSDFADSLLALRRLDDPIPTSRYLEAVRIFRLGRRKGYTIRSSVDCLIAAIAIAGDVVLWHRDRDFSHIARYTRLRATQARPF